MGQNTSNSVWKPCEDLQKTFDLCHCQQRVYNKVLRWNFVIDQILIFHHNLQINSLKILQCDLFCDLILSLIVEVYLWWKLQASLIFLSGRTCTIGGWLNTFLPHCIRGFQRPNYIDYTCFIVVYIRSDNTNIFENVNEFVWTEVRITTETFWSFTDKSHNSKVHLIKLTALLNFILLNLHTFLIFGLLFTAMLLIPH